MSPYKRRYIFDGTIVKKRVIYYIENKHMYIMSCEVVIHKYNQIK